MVSATRPVAAVQGLWQMIVRRAPRLAPNFIRVNVPRTAPLVPTMKLKPWNAKVSLYVKKVPKSCKSQDLISKYSFGLSESHP